MKKTILALSLVAALAACNRGEANNSAGAASNSSNGLSGLVTPPNRPADQAGQQSAGEQLMCVRNGLSAEQRRDVAAAAMEQAQPTDPRAQALLRAVDACTAQYSWSPQKRRLAGMFSLSAAGAAAVSDLLRGEGVSVEELDQAIAGDQALLTAAGAGQLGGGTAGREFALRHSALIQRLAAGREEDRELLTRIGNYIAFRATVEAVGRQFSNEP